MNDTLSHKILFPIETAVRELLYKLVLAVRFSKLGSDCYIGSKNEIYTLFDSVRPFVYFDKGYHPGISEAIWEKIKRNDGIIVNLDEEGGVDYSDSSTILSRYTDKVFEECNLTFLWGLHQYNLLKNRMHTLRETKIVVSGHPRFHLLKPPFHFLYQEELEHIKNKYPRYILFNTNMGFGNNIRGDDFVRENYAGRIRDIQKVISFDKAKMNHFLSLVQRLSTEIPDAIIIRPHPEENDSTYADVLQRHRNVKIVYEGSVIPWILGAEVLIHPDCTTGIESFMLGKKAVSYLPDTKDRHISAIPVQLSYQFTKEDEIVRFIKGREYLAFSTQEYPRCLHDYFFFENDSVQTIVGKVSDFLHHNSYNYSRDINAYCLIKKKIKMLMEKWQRNPKQPGNALFQKKIKGLDENVVIAMFNRIASHFHCDRDLRIKRISKYLYRIYP